MPCKFCKPGYSAQNDTAKEGDLIKLTFDSGRVYVIPANLDHMVLDHEFLPSNAFIGDVMNAKVSSSGLSQVYGNPVVIEVDDNYPIGFVPPGFPYRLQAIIKKSLEDQNSPG